MTDYTPPTQDEIQRVAAYWQRVKLLACKHDEGFTFSGLEGGPHCSSCGEVLHFMTSTQIENMRTRPPVNPSVRDQIVARMDRGGATVLVDGQWHDLRFEAWGYDGSDPASEKYGLQAKDIVLLLNATDVR